MYIGVYLHKVMNYNDIMKSLKKVKNLGGNFLQFYVGSSYLTTLREKIVLNQNEVDNIKTYMKKQTLIAIHNNGGGAFHFDLLRPFWQDSINFAALNLPGCAGSHWKDELNNINDFLIHLNHEINLFNQDNLPLVLLGHGSGALLALKYAKLFPVKSLILHSPSNNNSWLNQGFLLNLKNNFLSMEAFQDLNKSFFFSQYVSKQYLKVFFEAFQNCKSYKEIAQLAELDLKIALNNLEIPTILLLGNNEEDRKNKQIFSEIKNPNLLIKSIPAWHNFPMIENAGDYATEIMELAEQL